MPQNIELLLLPPHSPELNPTKHIWDYIREQKGITNHVFSSLDHVEDLLATALGRSMKKRGS